MTAAVEAKVCNQRGLHARAAARFCETASSFSADVKVTKDGMTVGGCSLMALLMLGAARGTVLAIEADGPDEEEAAKVLQALVEGGFGEES